MRKKWNNFLYDQITGHGCAIIISSTESGVRITIGDPLHVKSSRKVALMFPLCSSLRMSHFSLGSTVRSSHHYSSSSIAFVVHLHGAWIVTLSPINLSLRFNIRNYPWMFRSRNVFPVVGQRPSSWTTFRREDGKRVKILGYIKNGSPLILIERNAVKMRKLLCCISYYNSGPHRYQRRRNQDKDNSVLL